MTAAAFALALAALIAPVSSRRRIPMPATRPGRQQRVSVAAFGAAGCVAAAVLLPPAVVVASGLLVATLLVRRARAQRRRIRTHDAATLQEALEVMVSELRVGAHPVSALSSAARESDGQTAAALHVIAARATLGADVASGLRAQSQQSALPSYWDRLAVCWQLAQTYGLATAALMQAAHRDIAERERFRGRVEAGMAGARATAAILAGLPVLGVLLGHAIGAHPLQFLLSGGVGGWLLAIGTALICCGLMWSDHITSGVLT